MSVPAGTKTPNTYTTINTNTERTGLPTQGHSLVFVTADAKAPTKPTAIYNTAQADTVCGATGSTASKMLAAALQVSQAVEVSVVGVQQSSTPTPTPTPIVSSVSFLNKDTSGTNLMTLHSQIGILVANDEVTRGMQYFNESNTEDLLNPSSSAMSEPATMGGLAFNAIYELLTFYIDSTGTLTISAKKPNTTVKVELFPPKSPVVVGASPIDYNLTPSSDDITFSDDRFYFTLTKA